VVEMPRGPVAYVEEEARRRCSLTLRRQHSSGTA
jgi:hypothetical protein